MKETQTHMEPSKLTDTQADKPTCRLLPVLSMVHFTMLEAPALLGIVASSNLTM